MKPTTAEARLETLRRTYAESLTEEQREADIRKRNDASGDPACKCDWCFILRLLDVERARAEAAEAEVKKMRTEPAKMRVVGTWLVEETGRHTCGTGPDGYYGAHEPGCGQEPIVDLSTVPGFAALTDQPEVRP